MNKKRIALFGAIHKIESKVLDEALNRGHDVTVIAHDIDKVKIKHPSLSLKYGHMINADEIGNHVIGHDIIVAVNEPLPIYSCGHVKAARAIIRGAKKAGVNRLMIIGHPIFKPVENTTEFYDYWKTIVRAQREVLAILHEEKELNWIYVHSHSLEENCEGGVARKMRVTENGLEEDVSTEECISVLFDKALLNNSQALLKTIL